MRHTTRNALGAVLALAVLSLVGTAAVAAATTADERGAELLAAIERGDAACSDLDADEYLAIGELAMGRMVGSPPAHEAMDEGIAGMMGRKGLDRMHVSMGQEFAGCARGGKEPGLGPIMGMMGIGGSARGGLGPAGMMGSGFNPASTGSIMGLDRSPGDDAGAFWMVVAMVVVALGVAAAAFAVTRSTGRRSAPPDPDPLDVLAERLALGEISGADYTERRRLLRGGGGS